jgi:hypothetical protein
MITIETSYELVSSSKVSQPNYRIKVLKRLLQPPAGSFDRSLVRQQTRPSLLNSTDDAAIAYLHPSFSRPLKVRRQEAKSGKKKEKKSQLPFSVLFPSSKKPLRSKASNFVN